MATVVVVIALVAALLIELHLDLLAVLLNQLLLDGVEDVGRNLLRFDQPLLVTVASAVLLALAIVRGLLHSGGLAGRESLGPLQGDVRLRIEGRLALELILIILIPLLVQVLVLEEVADRLALGLHPRLVILGLEDLAVPGLLAPHEASLAVHEALQAQVRLLAGKLGLVDEIELLVAPRPGLPALPPVLHLDGDLIPLRIQIGPQKPPLLEAGEGFRLTGGDVLEVLLEGVGVAVTDVGSCGDDVGVLGALPLTELGDPGHGLLVVGHHAVVDVVGGIGGLVIDDLNLVGHATGHGGGGVADVVAVVGNKGLIILGGVNMRVYPPKLALILRYVGLLL